MKRTAFDESRDQRIANDHARDTRLTCAADGCPSPWSVAEGQFGDGIRGLCSAHYRAERHDWPAVTQRQLDAETDAAFRAANPAPTPYVRAPSQDERKAILIRLRKVGHAPRDPRAWARRLQRREQSGEHLTPAQREAWRDALRAESEPAELEDFRGLLPELQS